MNNLNLIQEFPERAEKMVQMWKECADKLNVNLLNMLKLSRISFLAFLLLILPMIANAQVYHSRIQVELPNQEKNNLKYSQPGIGCWFWVGQEFEPGGYKPFIDLYAKHTT